MVAISGDAINGAHTDTIDYVGECALMAVTYYLTRIFKALLHQASENYNR